MNCDPEIKKKKDYIETTVVDHLPSHGLLSYITTAKTTDSSEREMNPVPMTVSNPRKEYCIG